MLSVPYFRIQHNILIHLSIAVCSCAYSTMVAAIGTVDYNFVRNIKGGTGILLIDVRTKSEIEETGKIPGSINIPKDLLSKSLSSSTNGDEFRAQFGCEKPTTVTQLVFTCRSGKRAREAAEQAANMGYRNVWIYEGSWLDWAEHVKNNNQSR